MSGTRRNTSTGGPGRRSGAGDGKAGKGGDGGKGGRWDARTIVQRVLIAGIVFVLLCAAIFFFAYQRTTIPDPNSAYQAQSTYIYYAGGKAKIGDFAIQNRDSVPLADVPKGMQEAIVAAEDRTFWTNKGIDPKGIVRAAFSNAKGNSTQGASTITQQYVKLLYLNQQRTFSRKIKEIFLALKIQQQQSKQQILQGYLNTVYFGHGAYGVQAAAHEYFGIDAKQLSPRQSAMLAAIVNSPNNLDPTGDKAERQALLHRYEYVLKGMVSMGNLDPAKEASWDAKLPKVVHNAPQSTYGGQRGFMLTMVKKELQKIGFSDAQIDGGGLRVTTTFNRKAMKSAEHAVTSVEPKGLKQLHVGAASVDVKTGALLGFYGGQDFLKSQLNWATATDSPGSGFKVFALAMALQNGWSLKSTFDGNSPYTFPDGTEVHNEGERAGEANGHSYGSAVSLLQGLIESINTVYIDLTASTPHGPEKIRQTAVKMGIPDRNSLVANAGIALGSAPESPVDMANGYATVANGGVEHDVFIIKKVTDADGKVLWQHHADDHRALSKDVAADVSYAMQQVVQQGTGARAQALGRPAAGKTGTATNDKGDIVTAWFSGFTPQVSTAVMYVRGNGRQALQGYMPSYFGADYPAETWTAIMQGISEGMPVESFPPPAFVTGTPPTTGHAPYVPPPTTSRPAPRHSTTPKPKPTKQATPSQAPTPTPTPQPSSSPTSGCVGEPVQDCGGGSGGSSSSPTPTPQPSSSPTASPTQ